MKKKEVKLSKLNTYLFRIIYMKSFVLTLAYCYIIILMRKNKEMYFQRKIFIERNMAKYGSDYFYI